jgi:hypothetical protein
MLLLPGVSKGKGLAATGPNLLPLLLLLLLRNPVTPQELDDSA